MENSDDLFEQALSLARTGLLSEGLGCLEKMGPGALRRPEVLALKGALMTEAGSPSEAVPFFERALALDPANATAHCNYGNALARIKRPADAIQAYSKALSIDHDYALALTNRAGQRLELKQYQFALEDVERALFINPGLPSSHRTRALALLAMRRLSDALASIDAAIALRDSSPAAHSDKAVILNEMGRFEESARSHAQAVACSPGDPEKTLNSALARLLIGDYRGGWIDYEQRWQTPKFHKTSNMYRPDSVLPSLDLRCSSDDLVGKSVLLVNEQGIGDQLMFASMVPDLLRSAACVSWLLEPRLAGLVSNSFPQARLFPTSKGLTVDVSEFQHVIPLGSLGRLYRNRREDFPGTPYLRPRPQVADAWRNRLGPREQPLRIGISWRGGVDHTAGARRSMPLETLKPLLARPDCEFFSLQYGEVEPEVAEINVGLERPIRVFPRDEIDDFEQLAGLVLALDLVVSVQTSLIHLAGAVGATCMVMIPFVPEWRYGASGSTMPWYDSVRLFRQGDTDDWQPIIGEISAELDRLSGGTQSARE